MGTALRLLVLALGLLVATPVVASADLQKTIVFETTPVGAGTQEITIGFRPRFVKFRTHVDTTEGIRDHAHAMFGCAAEDSGGLVTQWAAWGISEDGQGTSDTARSFRNTRAIWTATEAGTVQMNGEVTTWGATSITITWHNVAAQRTLIVEAFGGSDLTEATCGQFTFPATTNANFQVNSVGYEPSFLMLHMSALAANGHETQNHISVGATDGTNQWNLAVIDEDNVGITDSYSTMRTDRIFQVVSTTGTIIRAASFTSFIANGFELNCSVASGTTAVVGYLAVGGTAQFAVGTFEAPVTDTDVVVSGLSFEPEAFEFISTGWDIDPTVQFGYQIAYGAQIGTSTSERMAMTVTSQDLLDAQTSKADTYYSTSFALSIRDEDNDPTFGDMTVTATSSTGFTTTWTTASWDAQILYWTIGAADGGGGGGGRLPCLIGGGIICGEVQ